MNQHWKSAGPTMVSAPQYSHPTSAGQLHQHQHNTGAAPAPPAAVECPTVPADEVGAAFALQYFKIMKTRPNDLFCFYNNDSRVSRGTFSAASGTVDVRHACGPIRIRELLQKEHSYGTRLSLAIINNLEAQDSAAGAVIVQITGTLKFVDDTSRDFVMSVFLVHQDSSSAFDYYVLNDILIFPQQTQQQDNRQQLPLECRQSPLDKPQQRPICKQGFNLPQQTRLTQEPIDPVSVPVAPSAQPAAAPLPTTTAPQLSGATNTPIASHDELLASLGSPAFSDNHDDPNMQQQFSLEQPSEVSEFDEHQHDESMMSGEERDSLNSDQPQESFGDLRESVVSEEHSDNEPHGTTSLGAAIDVRKPTTTESRQGSPKVEAAGEGSGTAATTTAPAREKKSVWKTTPVTSISSPEGFADISAAVSPTDKSKQQLLQPSGKSTEVATSLSSASTASKPFHPVDPSHYSESSYAAKLLRPGPNGLRAPCQTGFAVPPANGKLTQEKRERRPVQSYRNRPGRGKTLWVSLLPEGMTDDQIKKAVSDSLRGQSCEGHVIRIERLPNQQHGYIELDTEMCAKLLIEKGMLHLQGRPVTVDFPGKNQNQRGGGGGGGGGGRDRRRSFHQRNDGEEGTDEAKRQYQQQQPQLQQQQQQGRRNYNGNYQRYTNGYQQNGSANADGLANGNVANGAAPHNSTSSSLLSQSQENEEGWTPATARHRKPPQANRPRFTQQQNYNSGSSNNNPLNRRQNSEGTNQNGSNRNSVNNQNNNRRQNQPQQQQRQQPASGATANQSN